MVSLVVESDGPGHQAPAACLGDEGIGNNSLLASSSASSAVLNRIQTPRSLFRDFWAENLYNSLVRRQSSGLSPRLRPYPENHRSFDCKFKDQALGARHLHLDSLRGSDGRAQKQGISESAVLRAATGLLEVDVLPFLLYSLCSRVKKA